MVMGMRIAEKSLEKVLEMLDKAREEKIANKGKISETTIEALKSAIDEFTQIGTSHLGGSLLEIADDMEIKYGKKETAKDIRSIADEMFKQAMVKEISVFDRDVYDEIAGIAECDEDGMLIVSKKKLITLINPAAYDEDDILDENVYEQIKEILKKYPYASWYIVT